MMQLVQLRKIAMLRQGAVILPQLRNLFEAHSATRAELASPRPRF